MAHEVSNGIRSVSEVVSAKMAACAGGHQNIFGSPDFARLRSARPLSASERSNTTQHTDLTGLFSLRGRQNSRSLPQCGAIRVEAKTQPCRDRDVQQPKSFVWSLTRPANRLCLRRSPIRAWSIWFDCWRDRPHVTSFKPKRTAGRASASRSKEAAS